LPLVARDSGIWQTPTLGDSDMSSRAVGFILIYLERAHMVLEIAGKQALDHAPRRQRRQCVASSIAFSGDGIRHLAGEAFLR